MTAAWHGDFDGNPLDLSRGFFTILNSGDERLEVRSITAGEEDFWMEWTFEPDNFALAPGQERIVEISGVASWDAEGRQALDFLIESNDPAREFVVYPVDIIFYQSGDWGPWAINATVAYWLTDVRMNDEPVRGNWNMQILAPGGGEIGGCEWVGVERIVYMRLDDPETEEIEGLREDEEPMFRLTDLETDETFDAEPDFSRNEEWGDSDLIVLTLDVRNERELRVTLRAGWNLISTNVVPGQDFWENDSGPDIERMWEQLRFEGGHHVVLIKDFTGRFYWPRDDFCNIPYWNHEQAYQVRVDQAIEVVWSGRPIHPQTPISLRRGWNMVAYYPTYMLSAARPDFYVVSSILDHVILAKDGTGRFLYRHGPGEGMPPWREGQGYMIKVDQDVVLTYPVRRQAVERASRPFEPVPEPSHFHPLTRTGRNMSVLLNAEFRMQNLEYEVGAFTKGGLCVGNSKFSTLNSKFQIGLPVWGDDPSTPEIDGALEGEVLAFRLWDGATETVVQAESKEGGNKYETDGFALIELTERALPEELTISEVFPNPFNSTTTIRFDLPEKTPVRITLHDAAGRQVQTILDRELAAGSREAVIQGDALPAGVYLVKLHAGEAARNAKVVLVK
jgi:hypothetical protein